MISRREEADKGQQVCPGYLKGMKGRMEGCSGKLSLLLPRDFCPAGVSLRVSL